MTNPHLYLMIETLSNPDVLLIIFSFLSKKDLLSYDTAQTNKTGRQQFLDCLEHIGEHLKISSCRWTYTRKIWRSYESISITLLNFISPKCRSLFISTSKIPLRYKPQTELILTNNTIEKLHIDYGVYPNLTYLQGIKSTSLKFLTMVNVACCDNTFMKELIIDNCPNLKEIRVINNYRVSAYETCRKIVMYTIGDTKIIKK